MLSTRINNRFSDAEMQIVRETDLPELLSGYLPLGAVLIAALAVPVAWLQYGGESAFIMAVSVSIMLTRHWAGLQRMRRGEEPQFFRKWHY